MTVMGFNCYKDLRSDSSIKMSQMSFQSNAVGKQCVANTEDTVTKTNDEGLASMRKDCVDCADLPNWKCKYISCYTDRQVCVTLSRSDEWKMKSNVHLRSLNYINFVQWYCNRVLGINCVHHVKIRLRPQFIQKGY